jgi:transglutaminase-like putative cysteine protease/tetratricopeptide (TPR) repeat protein
MHPHYFRPSADASRLAAVGMLILACATTTGEPGPELASGQTVALHHAASGPEVEALLAEFYGPSFEPTKLDHDLTEALARAPDNPDLHEIAWGLARLRADSDAEELHSLQAALDPAGAAPRLFLHHANARHQLTVDVARVLVKESPDPAVRALGRRFLMLRASLDNDKGEVEAQLKALGALTRWRVIGPFDNDAGKGFLERYPPEDGIDLEATVPGMHVAEQWRVMPGPVSNGDIPFESLMWPNREATAYAVTFLQTGADHDVVLGVTGTAPVRVFLDGQVVASREDLTGGGFDDVAVRIHLPAGAHALLLKSANRSLNWSLTAHLTAADGSLLPDLLQSADPLPGGKAHASSGTITFEELSPFRDVRDGLAEARAHFLRALAALQAGQPKRAVVEAAAFAAVAPDNPLALLTLAQASDQNGEKGKAIDLADQGVQRFREAAPAFLLFRARQNLGKTFYEKAQIDAEAFLRLRPRHLDGQLLLAQIDEKRQFRDERCLLLKQAVADHPFQVRALRALAACRVEEGERAAAQRLLDQAYAITPGSEDVLYAQFDLARRAMDSEEASRVQRERFDRDPRRLHLLVDAGDMAARAGRADEARQWFEMAHGLCPDAPDPLDRLASQAFARGDEQRAVQLWTEAAERDPSSAVIADRLDHLRPVRLDLVRKFFPSEKEIEAAIEAGKSLKPGTSGGVVALLDELVDQVNGDGSTTRAVTFVRKAINDEGRDTLTSLRLPGGRLKILESYAVSPGGEHQEPSSVQNNVVRFRHLVAGSTVVLQFIEYTRPGHFLPREFIAQRYFESPGFDIRESRWTILLPKGHALHFRIAGDVHHTTSEEQGVTVERFEAHDVPLHVTEPREPPNADVLRLVSVSTLPSWDEFVRWERALLTDAFQQSTDVHALAEKLTGDATTTQEKLERLTHYVAQEVRYQQDYETKIAGVRPHSSRQVLERGYGDCKDKTVLLISLAREVGVALQFALVRTRALGQLEREIPNQQFNHAVAYVPAQPGIGEPYFIDATTDALDAGNLREDDQGAWGLVIDPALPERFEIQQIPFRPPEQETWQQEIQGTVGDDGQVRLHDHMAARGGRGSWFRRLFRDDRRASVSLGQLMSGLFPASTIASVMHGDEKDLARPFTVDVELDDSGALETHGNSRRLLLPSLPGLSQEFSLPTRQTPLFLGTPETLTIHAAIDLPPHSRVTELPGDFEETAGCLSIRRILKAEGTHLDLTFEERRTCSQIETAEYAAFREHGLRAVKRLQEPVAFEPEVRVMPESATK